MATQINPTRMELTRLKRRLKTAERGHKLLKDKRDEMVRRFIALVRRNRQLRAEVEQKLADASASAAVARAEMGDAAMLEALVYPIREAHIKTGLRDIMSVEVPTLEITGLEDTRELPYGFAFTSGELDDAVLSLAELLPSLIELAQLEKSCNMLADEIEKTRRRVNALEHVMIPEMLSQIRYISMKLDENERGSQTRLMKVKDMLAAERETDDAVS